MNNFWTVVGFTLRNKIRTKSFIVTTVIFAVILSIAVNIPYIISLFDSGGKIKNIGFIETQATEVSVPLQQYFEQLGEEGGLKLVGFPDNGSIGANEQALKQAIADDQISGYILFAQNEAGGFPTVTYKSESFMDGSTPGTITTALQAIKTEFVVQEAGLSPEQKAELLAPVKVETAQISVTTEGDGKTPQQRGLSMGFVYAMMIVLFMGIFITSQLIANEITAEKSSRVMEILVTSVSPLTQMFGKITGMFLVGIMQIGAYVIVFLINTLLPHNAEILESLNINFGDIDPMLYFYAVIFYLMGYFLFSTLFAAVGSIVSRTEDLAQALMPITMLAMAGFYIGIFGMTAPGAMIVKVASFIPFFAPFAMFLRVGLTSPALWEVLLSLALLGVTILILGWLSAKIYRTGVLMYGKRPSFKELRKAMKAFKV
ncbi:ABC transporter permease [Paenibacillaceae bacterium]|nr:ABC transporter permease [Paenibacillaceae bacterium]